MTFYRDARGLYRTAGLDTLEWLDYGFGTRHVQDWPPAPAAIVKQIHSNRWLHADGQSGVLGCADAVLTATPGTWVAVRTADCVPLLLADERTHAVAAVHAGWRGTVANIAAAAVAGMYNLFGSRPEDLRAAIGPAICGDCYEVSAEVAAQFRRWFPERDDLDRKTRVDLAETNRRQLVEAGLDESRIDSGAPCTLTGSGDFYSYRRSPGERGRMVTAIAVRR